MAIKANFKIYTLRFVTEELLAQFMPKIKELEIKTNTDILFNYRDQFFDIKGETQEGCDEATEILKDSLIPILYRDIIQNQLTATYEDVTMLKSMKIHDNDDLTEVGDEDDDSTLKGDYIIIGKPLSEHNEDDDEKGYTMEEFHYKPETKTKEFNISPLIKNVSDFMIGPIQFNMQPAEYEDLIPKLTRTDCVLKGRIITITGEESCVDDALKRFKVLENNYIAHLKVNRVVCIHYPSITGHYGLFFCNLSSYRHKSYIHTYHKINNNITFVTLPVFPDGLTGEYGMPKDRIGEVIPTRKKYHSPSVDIQSDAINSSSSYTNISVTQNTHHPDVSYTPAVRNYNNNNYIDIHDKYDERYNNKYSNKYDKRYNNKNNNKYAEKYNNNSKPINDEDNENDNLPESCMEYIVPIIPKMNDENFPSLSSTTKKNSGNSKKTFSPALSGKDKPRTNRIMRIIPQKAVYQPPHLRSRQNMTDSVKTYNYNNIKNALVKGLDLLRGFKGEIKLSARIGKVLWNNVADPVRKKIWLYHEINDIVIKELGAVPDFTNIVTVYDDMVEFIASEEVFDQHKAFNKTAIYEFYCLARNQPSAPYAPTIIHMNKGVIDVRKVVLKEKRVVEVDWVSLDRKFDFQLSLETKTLTRCDVKPYTTFINKISISPISSEMTFENIPRFVKVDYILFKQTSRYKITFPFIVEITRIERVPWHPVANSIRMTATPGTGDVWYEYEVRNTILDEVFQGNTELELGKEARWTSSGILGLDNHTESSEIDTITDYVKSMLILVEKIERALDTAIRAAANKGPMTPTPSHVISGQY